MKKLLDLKIEKYPQISVTLITLYFLRFKICEWSIDSMGYIK